MTDLDPGASSQEVSSSLSELERKLKLLESELATVMHRASSAAAADPPVAEPGRRDEAPALSQDDLDLLLRFRDQLERYSRALVTDYGRLLTHLGIADQPPYGLPGP